MNHSKLFRVAGVAAVVAGLVFVLLQFIHPDETIQNVVTMTCKVVHVMTLAMAILALVGVLGMYLRQVEEVGVLGFVAVVLYGCGFFLIFGFSFVEAAVLPQLADTDPRYVADVTALTATGEAASEVGGLAAANVGSAVTYLLGGVLFGVVLWRAAGPLAMGVGTARHRGAFDDPDPSTPEVTRPDRRDSRRCGVGGARHLSLAIDVGSWRVHAPLDGRTTRRNSGLELSE